MFMTVRELAFIPDKSLRALQFGRGLDSSVFTLPVFGLSILPQDPTRNTHASRERHSQRHTVSIKARFPKSRRPR